MRERLPLPNKIQNAPELFLGLELYYGAYLDLYTCRTGFGDGPISWQSVEEYAYYNEYTLEQKEDLHYFVNKMDEGYLKWSEKKDGRSK